VSQTLYVDGDCALCTRTVWFIDRRDRVRTLRFVALESDEGRALRREVPALAEVDSLIWVERDEAERRELVLTHSDAVLAVGRYLGGGWRVLGTVLGPIPRSWRDTVYRFVAKHRSQL